MNVSPEGLHAVRATYDCPGEIDEVVYADEDDRQARRTHPNAKSGRPYGVGSVVGPDLRHAQQPLPSWLAVDVWNVGRFLVARIEGLFADRQDGQQSKSDDAEVQVHSDAPAANVQDRGHELRSEKRGQNQGTRPDIDHSGALVEEEDVVDPHQAAACCRNNEESIEDPRRHVGFQAGGRSRPHSGSRGEDGHEQKDWKTPNIR